MKKFLARALRALRALKTRSYVIIDPRDSTLMMSRGLWREVESVCDSGELNYNRMYVFRISGVPGRTVYGFCVDPAQWKDLPDEAFSPLQASSRTRLVGCVLTEPTGVRICHDLGYPVSRPTRLKVMARTDLSEGETVWVMNR